MRNRTALRTAALVALLTAPCTHWRWPLGAPVVWGAGVAEAREFPPVGWSRTSRAGGTQRQSAAGRRGCGDRCTVSTLGALPVEYRKVAIPPVSVPDLAPGLLRSFAPARSADDSLPEAVLVELRLGQIAVRTVPAFRVGEEALLPLTQFFDLAGVEARLDADGRLYGTMQPGNVPLAVDPAAGTATLGRRRLTLDPQQFVLHDGELYLAASRLAELLDLRLVVDWSALEVAVPDPSSLPVAQQLRRQAARAALLRASGEARLEPLVPLARRAWDGFVVDYSLLAPSNDPLSGSAYSVAAGADLFGGSLELGVQSEGPSDRGNVRPDASWLGVWRGSRWVKQLRLGDGQATGPRSRLLRGAMLTNAPFVRPSLIGMAPFGGRLPPGWEIEAYRGGQLVGFDSVGAGGDFAVDLPILYGENPVDFVAYGPYGEQRAFSRTYRVENALLPAKRFEYGVSGGQCRVITCTASANADFRYGVTSRWTLQAGADQLGRDTLADLLHPYVGVTGNVSNAWMLRLEGVRRGLVSAGLNYEPSLDLRLFGEYTHFDTAGASPLLNPMGRRSQWQFSGFFRPLPGRDQVYLEARAERARLATGVNDRAQLGASVQFGNVRLLPYARVERDALDGVGATTRGYWGVNSFVLPRATWAPFLRQMWARTALEGRGSKITAAALNVARPILPTVRLELGVSWAMGQGGPSYTLTLSSLFRSMRAFTTANAPSSGPATLTQLVQGSVLYDRSTHSMSLTPGPALQRSGVAGHVYLDQNGNGLRDPGEPGLANVRVQVGPSSAYSDSTGAYRVWDIIPFEPVQVAVDSMSFESPLWVPGRPDAVVVPGPNRFTGYDVPLVVGAVVEGRVVRTGGTGVGGLPLILTERRTRERRRLQSFTDGSFYAMGVRPGEYELAVDPAASDALGLRAAPRRFTIDPAGEGAPAGLTLELVP